MAAQPSGRAAASANEPWTLGIALYSFHKVAFPEELVQAKQVGISHVEGFTFGKAGTDLADSLVMNLSPAGIEKLGALVKKEGLAMPSIYASGGETLDGWKREFGIARRLGVRYVTGEPPVALWDSLDRLAGAYGLKIAIHNHRQGLSAYWHPDSVLAALKNHPNFGACPDLGHWIRSGIDPVEGLKKLEGHLTAVHLKDINQAGKPDARDVPLGKGVLNLLAVLGELKRQQFTGYLVLEDEVRGDKLASVTESVTFYREQLRLLEKQPAASVK